MSKKKDEYVTTAATIPQLCKCLILKSQCHDPLIPNDWSDDTFNDIDWKSVQSSIKQQPFGDNSSLPNLPTTGLQPYINEPPKTIALINDALNAELGKKISTMSSNAQATCLRDAAQTKAKTQFLDHLAKYHTPALMANVMITALDRWFSNLPPDLVPRLPTGPTELNRNLHQLINKAFVHQNYIGWDIFYKAASRSSGVMHCRVLQSPSTRRFFNPSLWMQKTIDALWQIFLTIWYT
jgi:hypothetical protein